MDENEIPMENPRSLAGEEVDDADTRGFQASVLSENMALLERALGTFETEAWPDIAATIIQEQEAQMKALLSVPPDPYSLGLIRGQITALGWVVEMPKRIRTELARLAEERRQLLSEEEVL